MRECHKRKQKIGQPDSHRLTCCFSGAGDGNRTRVISLEGWGSTIELRPQDMVGTTGFEPATSCSQSRRATKLRHVPKVLSSQGQNLACPKAKRIIREPARACKHEERNSHTRYKSNPFRRTIDGLCETDPRKGNGPTTHAIRQTQQRRRRKQPTRTHQHRTQAIRAR